MVPSTVVTPHEPTAEPTGTVASSAAETNGSQHRIITAGDPSGAKLRGGWLGWVVFGALALATWYFWPQISPHLTLIGLGPSEPQKKPPPRVVPVGAAVVQERNFPIYLNGLGTITALKTVTIRSRVEGEVTDIAFTEGQVVHEGDLLAKIDPQSFEVQKQQAEGQLSRDEATLKAARLTLKRLEQLRDQKIATAQQIDDQLAIVQQSEGVIKVDQAQIDQAELQLDYCTILAPIEGRIGLRLVDEGNIVRPTDPQGIAVITQTKPIALVFTIPQDDIIRVQRRMQSEAEVPVEAYDRDLTHLLGTGTLLAIDNQVDPTNGTVKLKAEFENEEGLLFPNQFVNARLKVDELKSISVVPSAAVQRGTDGSYVYVVTPERKVESRPVTVAATDGSDSAISSGVSVGETVVTSGLDRLKPGAEVSTESGGGAAKEASRGTATGD